MIYVDVDRTSISFNEETKAPGIVLTPQNFQKEVLAFTEKTSTLAEQILNKDVPDQNASSGNQNSQCKQAVVIRHYYTPWYSPIWWRSSYQPVYVLPAEAPRQQDSENQLRCLVGVAAAVITGAALFAIGSAIPRLNDSERELDETHEFHEALDAYQPSDEYAQEIVNETKQIVNLKEKICKRIKDSAAADLALRISLAVGCGTALFAALFGSSFLMAAGTAAALIVAGGMLFKWGFETTDKQNQRDANIILNLAKNLNTYLN